MADRVDNSHQQRAAPGAQLHSGRHGPQIVRTRGRRWSDRAEQRFLDHLAATANISASAEACGFSTQALYARRRKDVVFQERWNMALAQGYAHIEALLVQRSIETLEGIEPDPATPIVIRDMTVKDALMLLGHHRRAAAGLEPRSRRSRWHRDVSIEEVKADMLRRVAAMERHECAKLARDWVAAFTGQPHGDASTTRNVVRAYRGQAALPGTDK